MNDLSKVIEVDINDILPNRFQPRIQFDENEILELSDSIKEHGIIQPLVVRPVGEKYEIIAGERRYKASVLAGKETVPVIVKNLTDKESAEIALIENIQRKNLTPIEEALSYKKILDMGYTTQESLAIKLGKSQPAVANKIRLLNLSDDVQEALLENRISERHARSLLKLKTSKEQNEMLNRIINERLTVRRTDEEIAKMLNLFSSNNELQIEKEIKEKGEINMNNNQNLNFDIFGTNTQSQMPVDMEQSKLVQTKQDIPTSLNQNNIEYTTQESLNKPTFEAFSQPTPIMSEPMPVIEPQFIDQPQTQVVTSETMKPSNESFDIFAPTSIPTQSNQETELTPVIEPQNFDIFNPVSETQVMDASAPITTPIIDQPQTQVIQQNENTFGFGPISPELTPVVEPTPIVESQQPAISSPIEPIIVTDYTKQYDPVMPQSTMDVAPIVDFKEVIKAIRECQQKIESYGYRIDVEEYDLENLYQAVFKIEKNK